MRLIHVRSLSVVVIALALLAGPRARVALAAPPFELSAEATAGPAVSARATGSNLPDLVSDLIDSRREFTPLLLQPLSGSLRYGELDDAVLFTRNATRTSATLTIPSTGFSRTFTASTPDELEDQIVEFFESEGADEYAAFLREVNRRTSLGVTDGNPLATTAILTDLGFYRFGFRPRIPGEAPIRLAEGWDVRLLGGVTDTDLSDGWFAGIGIGKNWRLGDRIGITWANNFRYRDVDGASIYHVGTTIGVPIALIAARGDEGLSWHLTPAFVSGFGGSWDLSAGGILVGGQITSSLALHANGWTFVLANQAGFYEGVPIEIRDFRFETDTSQQILKNGVQVIRDVGDGTYLDAGVAVTNLLDDAFVDTYVSADAGIAFRLGDRSQLRVGYHGDFSDDFNTHGGVMSFLFSY